MATMSPMKKQILFYCTLLCTASLFAQIPQKMSYQAVIRNSSNALVVSSPVGMRVSILQGSASGTAVYVETHTTSTNANGLVSIQIGVGTMVSGTFTGINWSTGPFFVKTETDPSGGTSYTIVGTSELLSVPYALFAASGSPGPQGPAGPPGPQGPASTFPPGTAIGQMLYWNGTKWDSIAPGLTGQGLINCGGIPRWGNPGSCPAQLPTVAATTVSNITHSTAVLTSNVINDGGPGGVIVTAVTRGFCWSTSPNPTIANSIASLPLTGVNMLATYSLSMAPLLPNTTYYVRSYATTTQGPGSGTGYGPQTTFTTPAAPTTLAVGDTFQGGRIAYILQPSDPGYSASVQHGLIIPLKVLIGSPAFKIWGCSGTLIPGADSSEIGRGNQNTLDIVAACADTTTAAYYCQNLVLDGFSDWYLPSRDEVSKMYLNRVVLGITSSQLLTSTESSSTLYISISFTSGNQQSIDKSVSNNFRACRSF
jgi:hypothetical protein